MRLVLDTNVVVAAMRSPRGASAEILRAARRGEAALLANVALALEYESVCGRREHQIAAALTPEEVVIFIDAVVAIMEPVETHFIWRPQLRDADDEFVLETAINGGADAVVTFNARDFGKAPSRFGLELLAPAAALRRMRQLKSKPGAFPLRLPLSLKAEVERLARADGASLNAFITTAVAEKLAAMRTASYFAEKRQRADFAGFDRLMARREGEAPAGEDVIA